ncbi:T9SS type A sorting domain-containing protein [Portibacter lacus]|uniref:Ig-like domain-containing protein n=1 Tax=Portibacter lacus TaxID=1099794 RepID=A0AA37SUI6_9BACT|nr:T9SS type A sorting domain-containing protein [Portibacter lacus]GLR19026.1 hypothetical protein GCM10007940_36420 [Portibacter lacus]
MKLFTTLILSVFVCISAFGQNEGKTNNSILRSGPGDTLTVSIESKYIGSETQVELDVRVQGFDSLAVFEGTIQWDTLGLTFNEVKNFGVDNLGAENFGRPVNTKDLLTFTWTEASNAGISVDDSTVIFTIVFDTNGDVDTEAAVIFADKPLDVSAADNKLSDVFVKEENGVVSFISPLTTAAEVTDLLCSGDEDGKIALTPSGASGNYSILWNNGEETATIENLSAGSYSFTITDVDTDLTFSETIELVSPDSILISFSDESMESDTFATITTTVSGGIPPYQYVWSNGDTTESLVGIANGTYDLTITDANNCEATATVEVDHQMSSSTTSLKLENWSVFPNPTSGMITVRFENGSFDSASKWRVIDALGKVVSEGQLQKNASRLDINLSGNVPGLYYVNLGDTTAPVLLK